MNRSFRTFEKQDLHSFGSLLGDLRREAHRVLTCVPSRRWCKHRVRDDLKFQRLYKLDSSFRWASSKRSSKWCSREFFLFFWWYHRIGDASITCVMSTRSSSFANSLSYFIHHHVRDVPRDQNPVRDQMSFLRDLWVIFNMTVPICPTHVQTLLDIYERLSSSK